MTAEKQTKETESKVRREMREHPERFDYADIPNAKLTPEGKRHLERIKQLSKEKGRGF